jgi:uncharacterized membrane protein YdjX (TVP38/TMEM64 family)
MGFWKHAAAHAVGTLMAAIVILVVGKATTQAVHISWATIGRIVLIAAVALVFIPRALLDVGEMLVRTGGEYRTLWDKVKRFRKRQ